MEKRKEIQQYVSDIIGDWKMLNNCNVLNNHSSRIRERTETKSKWNKNDKGNMDTMQVEH